VEEFEAVQLTTSVVVGSHIKRSQHFKVHTAVIFKGHCTLPDSMTLEDESKDEGNTCLQTLWNILLLSCCAMSYTRMVAVPDKCSLSNATWLNVRVCDILEHCVKKLFLHILLLVCQWSNLNVHF